MSMLTFFAALCTRKVNPPSLKLAVLVIFDVVEIVSVILWRTNVGDWHEENWPSHQSLKYTMSMLIFFAALHHRWANLPSLKLSVSVIIDDTESVGTDLQRANVENMKKINNHINPPNIYNEHAHLLCSFIP
jgi:hypothetical protein